MERAEGASWLNLPSQSVYPIAGSMAVWCEQAMFSLDGTITIMPLLAAPLAGSFVGVLIDRLPDRRPVLLSRSACDHCGSALGPQDLVPLISFAALRGRCRACGGAIRLFYPAVELGAVVVAACSVATAMSPAAIWAGCVLGWTLLALAWIDCRCMRLPDVLTLPLLLGGLGATWVLNPEMLGLHAVGAAGGYAFLRTVAWGYRLARKRDGLGGGDAKLLAAAGAWLGPGALPLVVLIAALLGLAAALLLALKGRTIRAEMALPFGPWLAAACWIAWLAGAAG